jgi:uncharacterized protein (DUF2141 family)
MPRTGSASTTTAGQDQALLRVKILGLRSSRGLVKVGLYRSEESYKTRRGSFRKAELPIARQGSEWVLEGLPPGEYALMFYHDENGNRRLDKNLFGIPVEAFGFSNNARPRLGPPSYEQIKFEVGSGEQTIEVRAQST